VQVQGLELEIGRGLSQAAQRPASEELGEVLLRMPPSQQRLPSAAAGMADAALTVACGDLV